MAAACEGATYVVHTASPHYYNNQTEDELIKPAVEGTMAVVKACKTHGVKRCVITGSCVSIRYGYAKDDPERPSDNVFDERHWTKTQTAGLHPYITSKTLAEKAAWDYQASLPEAEKFELITILPSAILGPVITSGDSTSEFLVKGVMNSANPELEKKFLGMNDVRDCALCHLKAIQVPEAKNQRFVCSEGDYWVSEFAKWLAEEFTPPKWSIITKMKAEGPDDEDKCSNTKAMEVLGM